MEKTYELRLSKEFRLKVNADSFKEAEQKAQMAKKCMRCNDHLVIPADEKTSTLPDCEEFIKLYTLN